MINNQTKRKPGRPKLPKNKSKGTWLQIRVDTARKRAYKKSAGRGRLSAWILSELDRACGYRQEEEEQ